MSKILVIEDNPMHLEIVTEILNKADYSLLTANDAATGINIATKNNPNLILIDINLPDQNGYLTAKFLKEQKETSGIPIIAITAFAGEEEKQKALNSGCDDFISKPININNFISIIEKNTKTSKNLTTLIKEPQAEHRPLKINKNSTPKIHDVLVIDDNQMNTELLKSVLLQINQKPTVINDGFKALKLIEQKHFDLILLDIMMPEINGYEIMAKIKKIPLNQNTSVIFISALNETQHIVKGLDLGSCDYITKPFNMDELKARILSVLRIKNLQDELKENNKKLDQINQFSADGIVMLNNDFEIVSCSNKFLKWFNKTQDEVAGQNFCRIISHNKRNKDNCEFYQQIINSDKKVIEKYNLLDETNNRHFELSCSQITTEQESCGFVLIIRDVTLKKTLEKQKENFIATLTHDLKTPIRAEITALELLLKGHFGTLKSEQKNIIEEILCSGKFMFNMVDAIVTKYRYENGKITLHKEIFDINELIKSSYSELKCLTNDKKQDVTFGFLDEKLLVKADIIEIKRVITNLFSNAISYTLENGRIIVKTKKQAGFAQISFIDNGRGISKEDLPMLFDKYMSYARKFRQIGTGLGLYVSKQIIEEHKGTIFVESEEDKGSTFTFTLPLSTEAQACTEI
ncbi:MAG: response regulator [Candidatus Gastranaerophilales bacterium]|nr:response regulator [Candidatus Gastranaerophilales bacterium]